MTSQWQLETKFDNISSTYRILLYGRSFCQILKWFWDVDPKFGLEKRISGQIGHFLVKNDVTAAVRNRIWWSLFDSFVSFLCKIILSKFEVILLSRSRVWTWAVHFTTKFGHLIVKNDVTMAVRKQFSFIFLQKLIICMLEIILAKFEVILASETPSFIPVLVQMYFFLTFKRCSSGMVNRLSESFQKLMC